MKLSGSCEEYDSGTYLINIIFLISQFRYCICLLTMTIGDFSCLAHKCAKMKQTSSLLCAAHAHKWDYSVCAIPDLPDILR